MDDYDWDSAINAAIGIVKKQLLSVNNTCCAAHLHMVMGSLEASKIKEGSKNEGPVEVWIDGACSGNPGPGGWAFIMQRGEFRQKGFGSSPNTTNNRMELHAAVEAFKYLRKGLRLDVKVYSDSEYLVRTMNGEFSQRSNWDLWEALEEAVGKHNIEWIFIKRDSVKQHIQCDALAREAAKEQKGFAIC
jgi:ribonuclease HI